MLNYVVLAIDVMPTHEKPPVVSVFVVTSNPRPSPLIAPIILLLIAPIIPLLIASIIPLLIASIILC